MVLPLLLLVLLGTSSVGIALSVSTGQSMTLPVSSFFSSQDRKVLEDARQAMVTYAALYPYMYGPRGAGPGHLPCPDTDDWTPTVTPAVSQYAQFRNDSPDPPCGRQSPASGFLPRHVRLPEQRYVFHTEPAQLASYHVSGRFINNPINRIVNPSLLLPESGYTFAARIELPGQFQGRSGPQVVVSNKALFSGVLPSVAGWVIEKSDSLTQHWCDSAADETVSEQIVAWQCTTFVLLVEQCPQNAAVLLIVDHLPRDGSCSITDLQRLSIDGVPARSHWFFRNEWTSWVIVENTELCQAGIGNAIKPCALQFLRPHYALNHSATGVLPASDFAGITLGWERLL
ncbi:MAG: hypothetical protein AB8B63_20140 [Granulosicoccus sp.]